MDNTEIKELNLDRNERVEATVESEERLFSERGVSDTGYILSTPDGPRRWSLRNAKVEGDEFKKGDRIEILLQDVPMMKEWPSGTRRSAPSNEPNYVYQVENLSSGG